MRLFYRMRLAISQAVAPRPEAPPTILQIVTAEKYECDCALLNAEAELERAHHTVEMLAERQTRLGEVIEAELERGPRTVETAAPLSESLRAMNRAARGMASALSFADHPVPPRTSPFTKVEGFGEPLAQPNGEAAP